MFPLDLRSNVFGAELHGAPLCFSTIAVTRKECNSSDMSIVCAEVGS